MPQSIAVIIPTYNRSHTLRRALDSVNNQTVRPSEICVVDDGSTDETEQLLSRHYPQVNYVYQSNAGVSSARNAGVALTRGHWLAFLDSDDEWMPNKLERQLQEINGNDTFPLVHCDEIWIRNGVRVNAMHKHQKAGGEIFERCLPLCVISPSAVMIKRRLFEEVGGFDESLPACEDYDLWLRICSRHPVLYIEEALLRKYGGHDDQLSRQHWGMDRFRVKALVTLLNTGNLRPQQTQLTRAMLVNKCEILAQGAGKRGNKETASYYYSLIKSFAKPS
jgi:glycosyltransferase involved in cell wall biosynthesis